MIEGRQNDRLHFRVRWPQILITEYVDGVVGPTVEALYEGVAFQCFAVIAEEVVAIQVGGIGGPAIVETRPPIFV